MFNAASASRLKWLFSNSSVLGPFDIASLKLSKVLSPGANSWLAVRILLGGFNHFGTICLTQDGAICSSAIDSFSWTRSSDASHLPLSCCIEDALQAILSSNDQRRT